MKLRQISRLLVQFSPWSGTARSARELVARATSAPARASNPDCEVETRVRVDSEPFVEVTYDNKQTERIATGALTVEQVLARIGDRAEEMDTAARLSKAGMTRAPLTSGWQGALGRETEAGRVEFIPRQQ